jgi:hypothetical protein
MNIETLLGKTITKIEPDSDYDRSPAVRFWTSDGAEYALGHTQDCCESFYLSEIHGDVEDLVGTPLLLVEESQSSMESASESGTWTFYKFATVKGHVTLRFGGESNGYYSESAALYCIS